MSIAPGSTGTAIPVAAAATSAQEWPNQLAGQRQAIRNLTRHPPNRSWPGRWRVRFKKVSTDKVRPLLDTLTALAPLRLTPEGQ